MSTQPMGTTTGVTAPNMAGPKAAAAAAAKQSAKMHRRSRSGCFTCRLRRKKCDEGKPACKACKHLGLKCEYKRPMWWSNNEQRRQQKEAIKTIIRRTKLSEKTAQMVSMGGDSPPELSYSLPTSDTFSDTLDRTRSVSVDSQFSLGYEFDFNQQLEASCFAQPPYGAAYAPYEVDVKTERQMFVNDVPTRRDSSISTFNTFQGPPPPPQPLATLPSFPAEAWPHEELCEIPAPAPEAGLAGPQRQLDFNVFEHAHPTTTQQAVIHVDECDRRLLDHFIDNVLRLIFPVLEVTQHGSARSEVILPALESNKCYLHCCLSISALHLKATQGLQGESIDNDIMRHRYATISELCAALNRDTDHAQILEATLGMIFFQCTVGRADDCLPDIPWDQHFQAATSLVHKLDMPRQLAESSHARPPFNMTLASWIDILGATMLGRAPQFADTYREKHLASSGSGLCELMGCDDRVMYLVSEIACLEALKIDGMDVIQLCNHIHALAGQIDLTEPGPGGLAYAYSSTGAIRPRQLSNNMTAAFRLAARIYLCSLVPGFDRNEGSIVELVSKLADCLEFIPAGPEGFDRSLVWPFLVGGSAATADSPFRRVFQGRIEQLGEHAEYGSFGRVVRLLQEVWRQSDERGQNVHWRDVMQQNGWHFLLI
ncbi:MAG: hypothetical protein M1832_005618 [Thelocarpon impressellum]|nr:MAG: hypothetical protein M1832_005618 [Thelocarpon impressellum]